MISFQTRDNQYEVSFYIGIILSRILHGGTILAIYFSTLNHLLKSKHISHRQRNFYIIYSLILFILPSIMFVATSLQGMLLWIIHRDKILSHRQSPILGDIEGTLPYVILFMDNMLMAYRCYIIFNSKWAAVAPVLFGVIEPILMLLQSSYLNSGPSPEESCMSFIAFVFLLPANSLATLMIATRIFLVSRRTFKFVDQHWKRQVTGLVAILVESAAPGTVFWIIFMTTRIMRAASNLKNASGNSSVDVYWDYAITFVWSAIIAGSPNLIMLRIAMGVAWDKNTSHRLSKTTPHSIEVDD